MRTLCAVLLAVGIGALAPGCKKRGAPTDSGMPEDPGPQVTPASAVTLPTVARSSGGKALPVTGPTDASGHVDYAAALNERLSKGVTADTNACAALWRVFGPTAPTGEKPPPGFFEKLGIPAPPAEGAYFIGLKSYCERNTSGLVAGAQDVAKRFAARPWNATESTTIAGWWDPLESTCRHASLSIL